MPSLTRLEHRRAHRPVRAKALGFTLLEVMVTIMVLTLGLLGLASLQAFSMKNNHVSYYHAIASQQAYDIEDRMRANLIGIVAGSYDNLSSVMPADPACVNTAVGCTPLTMATTDQRQWLAANAALLPNGSGSVVCIHGPLNSACADGGWVGISRVFRITVTWLQKDMGDTGATSTDTNCKDLVPPAAANTRCFVTGFTP